MAWLLKLERPYRLIPLCILLGVAAAFVAEAFLWLLAHAQALFIEGIGGYTPPSAKAVARGEPLEALPAWTLPLATALGGLVSGWLVYRFAPEAEGAGTDAVIRAYHQEDGRIRPRVPLIKALASAVTIGSGGSAGQQGPIAQTSGGVGAFLADVLRLPDEDRRLLVIVGMAAGLSAIFKSPLGSALFAIKVLYAQLAMETEDLGYAILAAATAYAVVGLFEGWTPLFYLPEGLALRHPFELIWYGILGVAAGLLGAIIPTLFYGTRDVFRRLPLPLVLKPALGGLLLGVMALFLPHLLGGGYGWIQAAIGAKLPLLLMLALMLGKIVATGLTVGSGGSGGVFAPTLFSGAMLGSALAACLCPYLPGTPDPPALTVVGMAAVFASAARVPLPTLIMVVEMTGGYGLVVPTMVAVTLSWVIQERLTRRARYPTLYEAQVPTPSESPVHQREYCLACFHIIDQHRLSLEPDEISRLLFAGEPIPLPGGKYLFMTQVAAGSEAAHQTLRALSLEDLQPVGVLRGNRHLIPYPDLRLEAGDWVAAVGGKAAMERFRRRLSSSATP